MNTFQQISRELVVEDLQRNKALHSTIACDPVKRQLIWRRVCGEHAGANEPSQKVVADETDGKDQLSRLISKCLFLLQNILWRRPGD